MKKYGDLKSCEDIDSDLGILVKQKIEQYSSFNNVWKALCGSIPKNKVFEVDKDFNVEYIKSILDKDLPDPCTIYLQKLLREDKDVFQTIFMPYAKEIFYYESDLRMCLRYNFECDKRKETLKKQPTRFNDIDDFICGDDSPSYLVPFNFKNNAFLDFCAYTWKSLYKDTSSMECFKNYRDRNYINPYIFSQIIKDLTCPHKKTVVTNNDCWLIEKIFGLNTIIALIPAANEYYSKENFQEVIIPSLNVLLKCKPVCIRISLANLVGEILCEIPISAKNTPYHDSKVNQIYNEDMVKNLLDSLIKAIELINRKYTTLLKSFYEAKIILDNPPTEIILAERNECRMFTGLDTPKKPKRNTETPIDIAYDILFNKEGNGKVIERLLSAAKKRNYNSSDLAWRYGTLQLQAIDFILHEYSNL